VDAGNDLKDESKRSPTGEGDVLKLRKKKNKPIKA